LQCVAVCSSVLQCVAVCCSVLQCVAVCCSVLQCVAVCCSRITRQAIQGLDFFFCTTCNIHYLNIPHVHIPLQGKEGEGEGLWGRGREKERQKVPGGICGERGGVESVDMKRCVCEFVCEREGDRGRETNTVEKIESVREVWVGWVGGCGGEEGGEGGGRNRHPSTFHRGTWI